MRQDSQGFYQIIAWWLPKKLVYYVLIRAWGNATTGKFSDSDATKITADELIQRWDI